MEFSYMRENFRRPALALTLAAVLVFSFTALLIAGQTRQAYAATNSITIDLSKYGIHNLADFPYGINCEDPDYVYVTLFNQGRLIQIDKDSKNVTNSFNDPDGNVTSGQGFYSITRDGSGNLWINERDNGKVWKVAVSGSSATWTSVPIVENVDDPDNADVSYPNGYTTDPATIRINENPGSHGQHTYGMNLQSFGGTLFANGVIYVGLSYDMDFDDQAEANAGVTDVAFSGVAKINPSTNAVTRIAIPGSVAPTGMSVDVGDGSIMWITDREADKVYKYDMDTDTVIQNITLTSGSKPRGIDNDATNIYVALNPNSGGNSEILQIAKSDGTQTTIDTGAENTDGGTFTVFVADNLLLWTDQSRHIGYINLNNMNNKSVETTVFADSNHFGCLVASEFWWAGHGSAVVGTIDTSSISFDEENHPNGHSRGSKGNPVKPEDMPGYCSTEEMAELVKEVELNFADGVEPINEYKGDFPVGQKSFHYHYYKQAYENATGQSFHDLTGAQRATVLKVLGYDRDNIGKMSDEEMKAIQEQNKNAPKTYKPVNPDD